MPRFRPGLALVLALLPSTAARAEILPTYSLRELAAQARTVVRAAPVDNPHAPRQFKVLEVLRGRGLHAGDTLTLDDLAPHDLQVYEESPPPGQKPRMRRVSEALLFLGPNVGTRARPRFQPVLSGLRFWTEDGVQLVPEQLRNPGGYFMTVRPADWPRLLSRARRDVAAVDWLKALQNMGPVDRRNRAILDWIEEHRHEFGGGFFTGEGREPATGWGSLETKVFEWVLESCRPQACWDAARLYAELNRGSTPPLHAPSFGSPAGRALLLKVALSETALEGDRVRAMKLLGEHVTLWPEVDDPHPGTRRPTEKEQADLIDRLQPLLKAKDSGIRAAAARVILAASHPADAALGERQTKRALPALVAAYRAEPSGQARDELAEAVCVLGGPQEWQTLTGNPHGLLVRLRDLGHTRNDVFFWLNLRPCGLAVYEAPTLLLERIDKKGKVVEKVQKPLPVSNLPRPWADGWDGNVFLLVQFPVIDFKPGTWRMTVQGTAGKGKERVKWTSEPKTFVRQQPPKKNGPQSPGVGGGSIRG